MFQRISSLLKKDFALGLKNMFTVIILASALMIVLVINFIIPKDTNIAPTVYYSVAKEDESSFNFLLSEMDEVNKMEDRQEIKNKMKKNSNSLGLILKTVDTKPAIEVIYQGSESNKLMYLSELSLKSGFIVKDLMIKAEVPQFAYKTDVLKDYEKQQDIPFNKFLVPLFILMEPALFGLILIATMVFTEKEERTHLSFAVTPGSVGEFLFSKVIFIAILSLVSASIIAIATVGFISGFVALLLIVLLASIFASSLGLIIASFFDDISKSMVWLVAVSLILSVPTMTYLTPSFSPTWMKLMPVYHLMFAIKEIIFPTGNTQIINSTIIVFLILSVVTFTMAQFTFERNLAKD